MIIHEKYMKMALEEAKKAEKKNEVPIGCVIVNQEEQVIATGYNQTISLSDPTAHAEILAIRSASSKRKNYRLLNTRLYVTVEPCAMCMGTAIHARISHIIFGAHDSKWGVCGSLYDFSMDKRFNHQPIMISGICMEACRDVIQRFFRNKRYLDQ